MASLRIIYLGTPQFAVPGLRELIASSHRVVGLISQPDRPKGRGQRLHTTPTRAAAETAGIPVLQPSRLQDDAFIDRLRALSPDLGVVAAYGRIIPDAILGLPRLGMINIHASLLPKYRGAAPIHRAVIDGASATGVTIMRVVTELDAGPTFATAGCVIGPEDTTPDVELVLAERGARLVVDVVDALAHGRAVEVPQDHAAATYAHKVERHEGAIEWTLPASQIHNLVRGLQPWPLASAMVDGARCLIHRTALTDEMSAAPAGTITSMSSRTLAVVAGDGRVLDVLRIQPEGRRVMSTRDFLAGRRLAPGARIEKDSRL